MKVALYKNIAYNFTTVRTEDFLLVAQLEPEYVRVSEWVEVNFPMLNEEVQS